MPKLDLITGVGAAYTTVTVDLHAQFPESYKEGAVFDVWVTPTRGHLDEFQVYREWVAENITQAEGVGEEEAERLDAEMYARFDAWLNETWRNWELDDVSAIREHLQQSNPAAWDWLYNETLRVMSEYRENLIKN